MTFRSIYIAIFLVLLHNDSIAQPFAWQQLPNVGLPVSQSRINDVFFINYQVGFAFRFDSQIFKTTDGGATWSPKGIANSDLRSIEFLDDDQTGIAGALDGTVYRTTDVGETWTDITGSIPDTAVNICGLAHHGNTFYGVGWYGAPVAKFYKSTDKGVTWQVKNIDTALATNLVDIVFLNADTGFATGGKNAGQLFISNASVVLKTTDGGNTWTRVFSDLTHGGRIWKVQALSLDTIVGSIEPFYDDTVCMIRSVDGGNNWNIINTGIRRPTSNKTQAIGFINGQEGWLGGGYYWLIHTADGGVTWDVDSIGGSYNRIFIMDAHHAYAGGASVYRLNDSVHNYLSAPTPVSLETHRLYSISPNPVKGIVKIEFDLIATNNVLVEVANIDTKAVQQIINTRLAPGHYTYYWDSSNAVPGVHIVWLGTDEAPCVQKFIVEK